MSDEKNSVSACPVCEHRAIWHHDERGCQYLGNSLRDRCPCLRNSDQVVARIVHAAMSKAADPWLLVSTQTTPLSPADGGNHDNA